jgi:hypothetical protein
MPQRADRAFTVRFSSVSMSPIPRRAGLSRDSSITRGSARTSGGAGGFTPWSITTMLADPHDNWHVVFDQQHRNAKLLLDLADQAREPSFSVGFMPAAGSSSAVRHVASARTIWRR